MRLDCGTKRCLARIARRFFRSDEGGVAIYVALTSVIMIGFGGLVVDLSRLFTLQTELQNAADFSALAGAAELDGKAGAIARARLAAKTALITNTQTFATGGADIVITDPDIRFLTALPPTDDDPVTSSLLTTVDAAARFIEVTASTRQVAYLLAPVLAARVGGDGTAPTSGPASAVAVAGYNSVVCDFPPLMICNPAEADGNAGAPFDVVPGQLIELKTKGGEGHWGPGNFGLLDPPLGNQGAGAVVDNLAKTNPVGCYSSTVDLRTGAVSNPVSKGINVRWDMYENPGFKKEKNNSEYKPAMNVTKGKYQLGNKFEDYVGSPLNGRPMPFHPCLSAGNCDTLGPSFHERFMPPADANAADQGTFWADYFATNHPGVTFANEYAAIDADGDGVITRKEVYDWENAGAIPVGDADGDGDVDAADAAANSSIAGENGNPMNYGGSASPDAKRRMMPVAVLNCIGDGPINGNTDDVPVVAFAKMFLSHPAEDGSEQTIYAEVVGVLQPGVDDDILHDIVQLYR